MPTPLIKSLADKSGKSVSEVEKLWNKAKEITKSEYNLNPEDDNYYSITVGILKKMLKLKESFISKIFTFFEQNTNDPIVRELNKILKGNVSKEKQSIIIDNEDSEIIISSTEVRGEIPKSLKTSVSKIIKSNDLIDKINYV